MGALAVLNHQNGGVLRRKGRLFRALRRSTQLGPMQVRLLWLECTVQEKLRKRKGPPLNEVELPAPKRPLRPLTPKLTSPIASPLPSPLSSPTHINLSVKKNKENRKPSLGSVTSPSAARRRPTTSTIHNTKPRWPLRSSQPTSGSKPVVNHKVDLKVTFPDSPTTPFTSSSFASASASSSSSSVLLTPGFAVVGWADPLRGSRADDSVDETQLKKKHEKREREEKAQLRRDRIWHNEVGWRQRPVAAPPEPSEPPIKVISMHQRLPKKPSS